MSDLIRRRDAVSRMSDLLMVKFQGQRLPTWNDVYQAMNDIPSAEPERKKGKWMYKPNEYDGNTYECSRCGEPWTLIEGTPKENNMNYCPNCGAKLDWSE